MSESASFVQLINDQTQNLHDQKSYLEYCSKVQQMLVKIGSSSKLVDNCIQMARILGNPTNYITKSEVELDQMQIVEQMLGYVKHAIQSNQSIWDEMVKSYVLGVMMPCDSIEDLIDFLTKIYTNRKACDHYHFDIKMYQSMSQGPGAHENVLNAVKMLCCTHCGHFAQEHKVCHQYQSYKMKMLVKTDQHQCLDCLINIEHTECVKYDVNVIEDLMDILKNKCLACGVDKYKHQTCNDFKYNNENKDCSDCQKSHYEHIEVMKMQGRQMCYNMIDNGHNYCANCGFENLLHMSSYGMRHINYESKDEILKLQVESLKMQCSTNLSSIDKLALNVMSKLMLSVDKLY